MLITSASLTAFLIITTVGQALATRLQWHFADADDFHSIANKEKMSQGLPLTDQDRIPWLSAICDYMRSLHAEGKSAVITCSALRRMYRKILVTGETDEGCIPSASEDTLQHASNSASINRTTLGSSPNPKTDKSHDTIQRSCDQETGSGLENEVLFVHLTGSEALLQERMRRREGHFMPASLLTSQLQTLEPLNETEKHIVINVDKPLEDIINELVQKMTFSTKDL